MRGVVAHRVLVAQHDRGKVRCIAKEACGHVRTGSGTGSPQGKRASRVGISSTVFGVRGVRAISSVENPVSEYHRADAHASVRGALQGEVCGQKPVGAHTMDRPTAHLLHHILCKCSHRVKRARRSLHNK